jgi:hypothetical protein
MRVTSFLPLAQRDERVAQILVSVRPFARRLVAVTHLERRAQRDDCFLQQVRVGSPFGQDDQRAREVVLRCGPGSPVLHREEYVQGRA